VRVAVIGAGVSGLVGARELDRAGHEVTVFESDPRAGGHSNTVTVETSGGSWDIDTGFIVYNERNYPAFERLLGELGVATQPASMSFSVSDGRGAFEWASRPLGVFARPSHLADRRFWGMLADLRRFFRDARELVGVAEQGPTLRAFCEERGYSDYFVERLIVPQVSAVWSADPDQLWSFPASFVAEFLDNHGALQLTGRPRWRTVSGGSRRYVEALTRPLGERLRVGVPVRGVRRAPDRVEVTVDGAVLDFDQVMFACHSDQALATLADPSWAELATLAAIPYQANEVVLHSDARLMPRRRAAWASWNYRLVERPSGRTSVTYHMNRLQSLRADREFFVTLNQTEAIDPSKVIREMTYSHPVYRQEGIDAQRDWGRISGPNRTHYCGAYWRWGFHEDGVWSAVRACRRLDAIAHRREEALMAGLGLAA
jgi:predicted NAD/FAD-binding protein